MTTILVNAEAKRDVLARVVMLLHRRGIFIPSFSMGASELPGILRMVITVETDCEQAKRLIADLYKIVNVVSVETAA